MSGDYDFYILMCNCYSHTHIHTQTHMHTHTHKLTYLEVYLGRALNH